MSNNNFTNSIESSLNCNQYSQIKKDKREQEEGEMEREEEGEGEMDERGREEEREGAYMQAKWRAV